MYPHEKKKKICKDMSIKCTNNEMCYEAKSIVQTNLAHRYKSSYFFIYKKTLTKRALKYDPIARCDYLTYIRWFVLDL